MRMEELSESRYIKNTDSVERYLLNLVQQYFDNNSNIASSTSREYIIKKAVERMKEELSFESIGVLSVTVPSGEVRTGAITITLEDLNGEPLISPKASAFNVPFGTEQNTACEGNDHRLSDARIPLEHQHEISDIIGLEGILSTLTGKVDRMDGFLHTHNNEQVLNMLVYTGDKTSIDLTIIDTLENKVLELVDEIRQEIIDYKDEVDNKITDINNTVTDARNEINDLKDYVLNTNKEHYESSKTYTDTKIEEAKQTIQINKDELVTRDMLSDIVLAMNNTYTLVGTMEFDIASVLNTGTPGLQSVSIDLDTSIVTELTNRGQLLSNSIIEILMEYKDTITGEIVYATLPHISFKNNIIDSSLQISSVYRENKVLVTFNTLTEMPEEVKDARIFYTVYSKQNTVL